MTKARAWGLWVVLGMMAAWIVATIWGERGYEWTQGMPSANERLIVAVAAGDPDTFDEAIKNGASAQGRDVREATALMMAAATGRVEFIERLIAMGADINATETSGQTALMMAARSDQPDAVRALLRHGADANLPDQTGETPLEAARIREWDDVVAVLSATDGAERVAHWRSERREMGTAAIAKPSQTGI